MMRGTRDCCRKSNRELTSLTFGLPATAFRLGLRDGIDRDQMAAILDWWWPALCSPFSSVQVCSMPNEMQAPTA